nr:hypothetical protein CFP56_27501 [Quercus suber]
MESSQQAQSLRSFQAINQSNYGASASTSTLAPRWVPKRGCVLRKVLKIIFKTCLCSGSQEEDEAAHRSFPNPSAVAPF